MKREGYTINIDYISNVYKFYKDKDLEIEFIVREIGRGQSEPYDVISFGIKAEGLRNMDILIDNAIAIKIKGYKVFVPSPQSYVLHKMIISSERKSKVEKDYFGIENLLDYIKRSGNELSKLNDLYNNLTKKQKRKVNEFCNINSIKLFK